MFGNHVIASCQVMFIVGRIWLTSADITSTVNVTIVEGQTAVLPCTISNPDQSISVSWLHTSDDVIVTFNDARLIDDHRFSVDRPTAQAWNLRISNVRPVDEGSYACITSATPQERHTVHLNVRSNNLIVSAQPEQIAVAPHGEVTLECFGVEDSSIAWRKDGRTLASDGTMYTISEFYTNMIDPDTNTLVSRITVHDVTADDYGQYTCRAENAMTGVLETKDLLVLQLNTENYLIVSVHPERVSAHPYEDVTLECFAAGGSRVVWRKDGVNLGLVTSDKYTTSESYSSEIVPGENTVVSWLIVHDMAESDYGQYACQAENVDTGVFEVQDIEVSSAGSTPSPPSTQGPAGPPTTTHRPEETPGDSDGQGSSFYDRFIEKLKSKDAVVILVEIH